MKTHAVNSRLSKKPSCKQFATRKWLTLGLSVLVALLFGGLPALRRAEFSRQVSAQQGITPSAGSLYLVNSTGDADRFVSKAAVCETAPGNGVCTLRAAIETANAFAGDDTIN